MEIKLNNVVYKDIFDNLNINIEEDKVTALIGKNGSGKTSFMNLIFGLDNNFCGEIKIGKNIINNKTKSKNILNLRKDISYLRQYYEDDLFSVNVYEDIRFGIKNFSEEKLNELLNLFDIDKELLKTTYINLSRKQKKKILLIKSLLSDKKILLLDDVTNGLDSKSIDNLIKILKREKRNNKIIIISSIDSDFLLKIADSFIIIDNKKIIKNNDKYNLFADITLLNKLNMHVPRIIDFKISAEKKKIKLINRDNINDLIKDIYRNAQK